MTAALRSSFSQSLEVVVATLRTAVQPGTEMRRDATSGRESAETGDSAEQDTLPVVKRRLLEVEFKHSFSLGDTGEKAAVVLKLETLLKAAKKHHKWQGGHSAVLTGVEVAHAAQEESRTSLRNLCRTLNHYTNTG